MKSKSISSKGRSSVLSGFNEDGPDNILMEIERHDSLISGLSSSISRPGTAPPPNKDDHLEKALYDAIFWRKESIANKDILSLVFVMMINCKNQEIVGQTKTLNLNRDNLPLMRQVGLGMPSKKKTSYGRKSSFLGGEGVRKKGQISLVKEQKK